MKKRTKLVALLMALVLVMGSMTACGGKDEPKATGSADGGTKTEAVDITLKVWVPQEDTQDYSAADAKYGANLTEYMCKQFDEAHPEWNITFDISSLAEGEVAGQLQQDPENGADVFMVAGDNLVTLESNGYLSSITYNGVDEVVASNPQNAIAAATFHNEAADKDLLYGVPFSPNTWFMYYDKSKFSEDDVKSLETMLAKDIDGCQYNFSLPFEDSWYASSFFFAAGCTLFGEDGLDETSCTFNDENGVAAGEYMIDLAKNKKFFPEVAEKVGISYLKEGKLAAWCGGTWDAGAVKEALDENYAATIIPTIKVNGKDSQMKPFTAYKYVGVNKSTKNPEAAQALAMWLGGETCQTDRLLAREVAPTWTSVVESETAKASVAVSAVNEQSLNGYIQPGITKMGNYWDPMKAFAQWANGKKADKSKVKAELDTLVDSILTELGK